VLESSVLWTFGVVILYWGFWSKIVADDLWSPIQSGQVPDHSRILTLHSGSGSSCWRKSQGNIQWLISVSAIQEDESSKCSYKM
jgi:hypothetical protein